MKTLTKNDKLALAKQIQEMNDQLWNTNTLLVTVGLKRQKWVTSVYEKHGSSGLQLVADEGTRVAKFCDTNADDRGNIGSQNSFWKGWCHCVRRATDHKKTMKRDSKTKKAIITNAIESKTSPAIDTPTPNEVKANDPVNLLKEIKKALAAYNKLADVKLTLQKAKK